MVRHILRDGKEIKDITGYKVRSEEINSLLDRINGGLHEEKKKENQELRY